VPGGVVFRSWRGQWVYLLGPYGLRNYSQGGLSVSFGARQFNLNENRLSNVDWLKKGQRNNKGKNRDNGRIAPEMFTSGQRLLEPGEERGKESKTSGSKWVLVDTKYSWQSHVVYGSGKFEKAYWKNNKVTLKQEFKVDKNTVGKYLKGKSAGWRRISGSIVTVYYIEYWEKGPNSGGGGGGGGEGEGGSNGGNGDAMHLNPYDVIADYKRYDAENASHFDGPEHEVVYVNEQLRQSAPQYNNLAYMGLRINSTKEWSSFQQLSVYLKEGIVVERLVNDAGRPVAERSLFGPTNNLAEIVYALLTDRRIGAGEMIGRQGVSRERMQQAARWCHANGFTWDGVISEKLNLRQWIFEQAGYALLDFTVLGGQFSLVPSFPRNKEYKLSRDTLPKISALFTDGNIRNLNVAWLAPEERQLFKAVVKWRQETTNGFPRTRLLSIRLSDAQGGSDTDPEETFDLSGFCTTEAQARLFARVALKLRKETTHGLSFETTPAGAMGLEPGAYFRLVSEATHTSRFNNGSIDRNGRVNTVGGLSNGNHRILYWKQNTQGVKEGRIRVVGGVCNDEAFRGTVFTVLNTSTSRRLYKVETLAYAEDGFVTVTASHQPVTTDGRLRALTWADSHFVEERG
jgi:hypothetical protein